MRVLMLLVTMLIFSSAKASIFNEILKQLENLDRSNISLNHNVSMPTRRTCNKSCCACEVIFARHLDKSINALSSPIKSNQEIFENIKDILANLDLTKGTNEILANCTFRKYSDISFLNRTIEYIKAWNRDNCKVQPENVQSLNSEHKSN